MIDDKTANLNLPLPHSDNQLSDDVERIRLSFGKIDTAVKAVEEKAAAQAATVQAHGESLTAQAAAMQAQAETIAAQAVTVQNHTATLNAQAQELQTQAQTLTTARQELTAQDASLSALLGKITTDAVAGGIPQAGADGKLAAGWINTPEPPAYATEAAAGIVTRATLAEVAAGENDTKYVTPSHVSSIVNDKLPGVLSETITITSSQTWVAPFTGRVSIILIGGGGGGGGEGTSDYNGKQGGQGGTSSVFKLLAYGGGGGKGGNGSYPEHGISYSIPSTDGNPLSTGKGGTTGYTYGDGGNGGRASKTGGAGGGSARVITGSAEVVKGTSYEIIVGAGGAGGTADSGGTAKGTAGKSGVCIIY